LSNTVEVSLAEKRLHSIAWFRTSLLPELRVSTTDLRLMNIPPFFSEVKVFLPPVR